MGHSLSCWLVLLGVSLGPYEAMTGWTAEWMMSEAPGFVDTSPSPLSLQNLPHLPFPHWSWDTFKGVALLKSRKKGPSCLGRKVVGVTL